MRRGRDMVKRLCIFMGYESCFYCRLKILEDFHSDLTSNLFILASYFNNLFNNGIVIVNMNNQNVEYHQKEIY